MKAIVLRELGGPSKLHLEEFETPVAGPGEMLIAVNFAAFNRRDVFITQGLYPGIVLPVIPGSDGCGVVAAHGPGASGPPVGASVVINPMFGWGDDPRVWNADSNAARHAAARHVCRIRDGAGGKRAPATRALERTSKPQRFRSAA